MLRKRWTCSCRSCGEAGLNLCDPHGFGPLHLRRGVALRQDLEVGNVQRLGSVRKIRRRTEICLRWVSLCRIVRDGRFSAGNVERRLYGRVQLIDGVVTGERAGIDGAAARFGDGGAGSVAHLNNDRPRCIRRAEAVALEGKAIGGDRAALPESHIARQLRSGGRIAGIVTATAASGDEGQQQKRHRVDPHRFSE